MPANNKKQVEKNVLTEEEKKQNAQKLVNDIIAKSEAAFRRSLRLRQEGCQRLEDQAGRDQGGHGHRADRSGGAGGQHS